MARQTDAQSSELHENKSIGKPTDLEVFLRTFRRYVEERSRFRGNIDEDDSSFSRARALRGLCLERAAAVDEELREGLDGFFHLELSDRLDELPALKAYSSQAMQDTQLHDCGVRQRLEDLMNPALGEGYATHVDVVWHQGRRVAEMNLYRVLDRQTVRIGERDIEEYFVEADESVSPFPLKTHARVGRGRIYYCVDRVYSPRYVAEQWVENLKEKDDCRQEPLDRQIASLYARALREDTLTPNQAVIEMMRHEREHISYPVDESLVSAFEEAGLLAILPGQQWSQDERRDAVVEAAPFLLQLAEGGMVNSELAQFIAHARTFYKDHHQPAAVLVLDLLCRYNSERGNWIDTSGGTLQERLRDIDTLTAGQIREAAAYWYDRFYELKESL